MTPINPPFPVFSDVDGQPLEDGYVYIGVANQNPEVNPVQVFWDAAGTIPAVQPIRTSGGYAIRNGTPSVIYVNSDYSITVRNKNGTFIYSAPSSSTAGGGATASGRVINVYSLPGVDPTGATDSTLALTAAALAAEDGDTFDFGGGTYLISYQGAAYSSPFGNVVMDFNGARDLTFLGRGATIKVNNHNITTYGGLMFMNFKGCKRIDITGFNFDMTFQGVNTNNAFYPFVGAITMLDDDDAAPDFETLNSDFRVDACTFKLYHPYGNWALSGGAYGGDPNNGYKLLSIFASGPYTPTDYNNQCRNISVTNSTWYKGHNGYGIWFWAWNNCRVSGCVAEDWVAKYSNAVGAYQNAGVSFIRHIPFRTQGIVVENNFFRAKPSAERTLGSGFEGGGTFYIHANNMGDVDWAEGLSVVANNTIIMGLGAQSGTSVDTAVFFNGFGQLIIEGNTIDGHNGQDPNAGYTGTFALELTPAGLGSGNGFAAITVNGNIFGAWLLAGIYFTNGASTEYRRRCKSLVVTNNQHLSGDFFLRTTSFAGYQAYEGCREMIISGNTLQSVNAGTFPPPSINNYGIAIAATQPTDVVICSNNVIKDHTYDILTLTAFCSSSAIVRRFNNTIANVTTPYYASNVFPADVLTGNQIVQAISSDGSFSPYVKCTNTNSGTAEVMFYQQATTSYILATNKLEVFTDAASQTVTDSDVFRPSADNTKTLGNASFRWSVVYAGTGTINTSDERVKTQIQDVDAAVMRAWGKVRYTQFKFTDAVQEKGVGARWHFGLIAQRVKAAFESEGLDAFAFGILCYDQWEDQWEEVLVEVDMQNPDGTISKTLQANGEKRLVVPAGNRYGVRYEEALALECAYLRSKLGV